MSPLVAQRDRHGVATAPLPHWPSRSRSSRERCPNCRRGGGARQLPFPTFPLFVKVGSTRQGGRPRGPRCARRACGGAGASSFSRERCPMPGRGTNCRRRRYASAVPSTFHKSWTLGFARRGEAHARARCARRACGGAGASLASLCARLERVEGLRNRPRLRSVRCGAGWGTRCGAPARGRAGRTAARGRTDGSRPRAASRGAPGPASVVAWCSARCGAQCGAVCAWPPSAGRFGLAWHAGGAWGRRRGARGRRAARARSFLVAGGPSAHTPPCEVHERAPA